MAPVRYGRSRGEAVRGADVGDLPDDVAEDVREAYFALLAAKGRCEVTTE